MSLTNKQKQNILDLVYSSPHSVGGDWGGGGSQAALDLFAKHGLNKDNLFTRGEPVTISGVVVKRILWAMKSQQTDLVSDEDRTYGRGIICGPATGYFLREESSLLYRMVITPYSPYPEQIHISKLRYPNS